MITKKCKVCGKEIKGYPCNIKTRIYCSNKCHGVDVATSIIKKCKICGKEFRALAYSIKDGNGKYCSRKCSGVNHTRKSGILTKTCIVCGKIFQLHPYRIKHNGGRYCSKECSRIGRITKKEIKCKICGKKFKRFISHINVSNGEYCSRECFFKAGRSIETRGKISEKMQGEKCHLWKGGISFEPYGREFNKRLRAQIRDRDNHKCQECGKSEKRLKRKLDCHHINYIKIDNRAENLIALCHSCHVKTNFDRTDWEKYFKAKTKK